MIEKITNIRPEFFDIFGITVFTFILIIGITSLYSKKKLPKWTTVVLVIIGILGLLVDGMIVFKTYLTG